MYTNVYSNIYILIFCRFSDLSEKNTKNNNNNVD
jgi:hypothetical protein